MKRKETVKLIGHFLVGEIQGIFCSSLTFVSIVSWVLCYLRDSSLQTEGM